MFAAGPGSVRAGKYALAAADAFLRVALRTEVNSLQCFNRLLLTCFDAGTAADAALRIELWLSHAHDVEVVHADFGAVVRTASQRDLEMKIVRKD